MNFFEFVLEVLHYTNKKINGPQISYDEMMPAHSENEHTVSSEQEKIKKYLKMDAPCMLARFGTFELSSFVNYLQVTDQLVNSPAYTTRLYLKDECFPKWFSLKTKHFMKNNTGFFPTDDQTLLKWGKLVQNDLQELDALFTWQSYEQYISNFIKGKEKIICSEMYYPYMFENPWTEELKDKKVLVVSPFADLIEEQYKNNRERLFKDPRILPEFELNTIEAYNVLGGINPYPNINTWFDALNDMERQMDEIDFDVALLGCGAYAFDLAAHAKRKGNKAITMCGSLQILFGIYGTRFEQYLKEIGILNEYWIRPDDKYKPKGYQKVENGAYW